MAFDPSQKYTRDQLVRFARMYDVKVSEQGKSKPKERLMANVSRAARSGAPTRSIPNLSSFDPQDMMQFSTEGLRQIAKDRKVPLSDRGVRKTKLQLVQDLIKQSKGLLTVRPRKTRAKRAPKTRKASATGRKAPKTFATGRRGFATANLKPSQGFNSVSLPTLFDEPAPTRAAKAPKAPAPRAAPRAAPKAAKAPRAAAPRAAPKTFAEGRRGFRTANLKPSQGFNSASLPTLFDESAPNLNLKPAPTRRSGKTFADGRLGFRTANLKPSQGFNSASLPTLFGDEPVPKRASAKRAIVERFEDAANNLAMIMGHM
jgi:hypothetical protein